MSYTSFDYLWWVLVGYFVIRLLKSDGPPWWVAIGAAIGLGVMTKILGGLSGVGRSGRCAGDASAAIPEEPMAVVRGGRGGAIDAALMMGQSRDFVEQNFASCELVGRLTNRYGIENSSIGGYADGFVCRNLRQPWPEFWEHIRTYG